MGDYFTTDNWLDTPEKIDKYFNKKSIFDKAKKRLLKINYNINNYNYELETGKCGICGKVLSNCLCNDVDFIDYGF